MGVQDAMHRRLVLHVRRIHEDGPLPLHPEKESHDRRRPEKRAFVDHLRQADRAPPPAAGSRDLSPHPPAPELYAPRRKDHEGHLQLAQRDGPVEIHPLLRIPPAQRLSKHLGIDEDSDGRPRHGITSSLTKFHSGGIPGAGDCFSPPPNRPARTTRRSARCPHLHAARARLSLPPPPQGGTPPPLPPPGVGRLPFITVEGGRYGHRHVGRDPQRGSRRDVYVAAHTTSDAK